MDKKFFDALELVIEKDNVSISMLQMTLKIGYARAGAIVEMMEEKGYISSFDGTTPRKVFITKEFFEQLDKNSILSGEKDLPPLDFSNNNIKERRLKCMMKEYHELQNQAENISIRMEQLKTEIYILRSEI